jgi:hypothetical protein
MIGSDAARYEKEHVAIMDYSETVAFWLALTGMALLATAWIWG